MGRDLIFLGKNFFTDLFTDVGLRILDEIYFTVRDVREIAHSLATDGRWDWDG